MTAEMSAEKIDIAIALFEKGFAKSDVEAAVEICDSVPKALKWLKSGSATVAADKSRVTPAPGKRSASSHSPGQRGSTSNRQPATPQRGGKATARRDCSPGPKMSAQEETCQICFNEVTAGAATRLCCGHGFYCIECLRRHAEARIAAGQIDMPCPECTTKVQERDLRRLLPAALLEQMLSRSLERAVSSIADFRTCPTPNCPMRVVVGENESGRMNCPTCRKQSCVHCGVQPYHKGLTCEEAGRRMKRGSAADVERQARLFQQWMMKTGTKQCPKCHTAVSKQNLESQGTQYAECHKMVCLVCTTRFCFKCCAILSDTYTCGCSNSLHGFINPKTGKRIVHKAEAKIEKAKKSKAEGKTPKGKAKAKTLAKKLGRPKKVLAKQLGRPKKVMTKVKAVARPVGKPKQARISK